MQQQGHEVVCAYMKNWVNEDNIFGDCPWEEDIQDARSVADKLGLEFRIVNLIEEYRERIVNYMLAGYQEGITPNPDVMCNREIKFGAFLDYADEHGFEAVATGHYCRNTQLPDGSWNLLEGLDPNKDQSYFLALMQQHQVARARFPIGELLKPRVRELAAEFDLSTATKKDSQGICFIGKVRMADFLRAYVKDDPGWIVDADGKRLGKHNGLHFYTLGQRKGIGVASNTYKSFYVVVDKRPERKELVVAIERDDTPHLYATECLVNNLSYCNHSVETSRSLLARPRYRAPAAAMAFEPLGEGRARIVFDQPQRALTPGQICALYDGTTMLGGGFFEEIVYGE